MEKSKATSIPRYLSLSPIKTFSHLSHLLHSVSRACPGSRKDHLVTKEQGARTRVPWSGHPTASRQGEQGRPGDVWITEHSYCPALNLAETKPETSLCSRKMTLSAGWMHWLRSCWFCWFNKINAYTPTQLSVDYNMHTTKVMVQIQ